ncbi:hypothetical protein PENANT_c026G05062 [Penicillium antarcticum]|uniref:Xylanolytic transcriptional activator regulatory domain-containing protein n=1 Tax=Penicillium antarcticum TaxID=416450 RepID=A0A1V6PX04_9EURO|nr:uncharacterized protein N7508_000072 [Penicillium antarcticum]KAJ5319789.1 hypothetical protein N7508_000072 [Penicillium antarcticum]OQD81554.1 hypothetical protein PENANT_c026G05062 [Penicillium antarcticum]
MVRSINGDIVRDKFRLEKGAAPNTHVSSQASKDRVELGRLEVKEGEIRYMENSFWVTLSDEVSGMKDILDACPDYESDTASLENGPSISDGGQAYVYSFNSIVCNLAAFYPTPDRILLLWQIFVDQVDPIIRMLHKPTMQAQVIKAKDHAIEMSKPNEALLFAIYFASITSMNEKQCRDVLQEGKASSLRRYRFAVEQSLARAEFLSSHNLVTLQALFFSHTCQRNHDDSRLVWTLTATAIRIAQSLGIHRDGSNLELTTFDTEMRRRVWWQICILDVRTAENHGSDQDIAQQIFDTRLPSNIDDEALVPGCLDLPLLRTGITEMSLSLMRYEIINVIWQLRSQSKACAIAYDAEYSHSVVQEIDRITDDCSKKLESQILQYCDMHVPFHWLITTVARMMLAKMWINVHHRFQLAGTGNDYKEHGRDRIFSMSLTIVETCLLLEREQSIQQWRWAFRNYVPWQALTFILSELCVRKQGDITDRAWKAVRGAFLEWADCAAEKGHDTIWLRMKKLLAKAQRANGLDPIDLSYTHIPDSRPFVTRETGVSTVDPVFLPSRLEDMSSLGTEPVSVRNPYLTIPPDAERNPLMTQWDGPELLHDDISFPTADDYFSMVDLTTTIDLSLDQDGAAAQDLLPSAALDNWWQ